MRRLALIVALLLLAVLAAAFYTIYWSRPKIEVVGVSKGEISEHDGKIIVEVRHWEHFNITFKTSPRYARYRIVCFCDSINFTQGHPLKGRECGGYGVVDENGYCISTGWVADTPPGLVVRMKCYLVRKEEKVKGSELEIYLRSVEEG